MLNERVFKIISQVMDVPIEKINENSSPDTLDQWDSLQHMNLILALEEEFRIKFTDEEIIKMTDVKLLLNVLNGKNVEKN